MVGKHLRIKARDKSSERLGECITYCTAIFTFFFPDRARADEQYEVGQRSSGVANTLHYHGQRAHRERGLLRVSSLEVADIFAGK